MSDDYDDEDQPGGLWDPDAFTPPPAPTRPALHIVSPPATADRLDRRVPASNVPDETDHHPLVRLEQFRTASGADVPQRSQATRPMVRRAWAAGILASVVAAVGIAYDTPGSPKRSHQPASTPPVAAVLAVDSERAAATRQVASADSRVRNSRQPKSGTKRQTESKRRSITASHNRSAPRTPRAATVSSSRAPATDTASTVVRTATPAPRDQTPVTSATSEFGFEG
jgi:hypothetical protein